MKPAVHSGWQRDRIWAIVVVVALHALAFYGLSFPGAISKDDDAMELVFVIPALEAPEQAPRTELPAPSSSRSSRMEAIDSRKSVPETKRIGSDSLSKRVERNEFAAEHVNLELMISSAAEARITFERDPLAQTPDPLGPSRPERFRMRASASPRDIVRSVSQALGFWPPGYTDDPCGGIRQSVQMLTGATSERAQVQLIEALQAEHRYCR